MSMGLLGGILNKIPVTSVQRGSTSVAAGATVNVTITAVDTSKAFVVANVGIGVNSGYFTFLNAALTSSTNLQLVAGAAAGSVTVKWEVVEIA